MQACLLENVFLISSGTNGDKRGGKTDFFKLFVFLYLYVELIIATQFS